MEACLIKDLRHGKENRTLTARIIRLWQVTKQSIEASCLHMLLIDEEKTKIQASIYNEDTLNKHISHLHEGRCYAISKFNIGENSGQFKTTKHQFRITIHYGTVIKPCDAPIPYHAFNFVPFETILSETKINEYLIDAIGVVSEYGHLQDYQHEGLTGKRLEFKLLDESNNSVRVTLFGERALEMFNFLTENTQLKVVVLQLARITHYKGQNSLITSWNTTKIIMNPNLQEAAALINMYSDQNLSVTQSTGQITFGSMSSSRNIFSDPNLRKTITEIRESKQPGRVTTVAKVHEIIEDNNWFYQACSKCSKSVNKKKKNDGALWCDKCKTNPSLIIPKYRIYLRVMDQTGNACFVLFEKEAFNLFHKSAAELRNDLIQIGNEFGFPDVLYSLVGKKFVFMVEINQEFNVEKNQDNYTIIKLSNDDDLIQEFDTNNELAQECDGPDASHILNLPQQPLFSDIENVSAMGDNESEQSITPLVPCHKKRKTNINIENDYMGLNEISTPQFSTSKSTVQVKREKSDH